MAGQIIISNIKTDSDNAFSILANTGAVLFSANLASGITTGIADGSVTNAKLAGSITGDKITVGSLAGNVFTANTITGDKIGQSAISSNNIVSVNASVASVGTLPKARLPAGTVLQVVSNTKTDTFTTSSTTDVAITGLSATITPTSATSKILVLVNIGSSGATISDYGVFFSLYRSASVITGAVGASPSSRKACSFASRNSSDGRYQSSSIIHQDSPASTSSLTYACYASMESGGGTACINRSASDGDQASSPRTISSITVMEIAV